MTTALGLVIVINQLTDIEIMSCYWVSIYDAMAKFDVIRFAGFRALYTLYIYMTCSFDTMLMLQYFCNSTPHYHVFI